MPRAPALAVLPLAVLLAGCLAPAAPPVAAPVAGPGAAALHLSATGSLEVAPDAEPTRRPLGWAWAEWLAAAPPPTWVAAPAAADVLVANASVTVSLVAGGPAVSTGQRPELTAWWGIDGMWVHHAFLAGPPALAPGEVLTATIPLDVPLGGLAVPAGSVLMLSLATYYADGEALRAIDLILGDADAPTRLDLVTGPLALGPVREEPLLAEAGAMLGGRCLGLDGATAEDMRTFPLDLPGDAVGLRVALTRTGGQGPPDLDLALVGPSGDVVARAQGPLADEHLTLREANLDAAGRGPWEVRVYNCTPQASEFRVEAALLRAA